MHEEASPNCVLTVMYEEASQVANDAVGSIRTVASFCAEQKMFSTRITRISSYGTWQSNSWRGFQAIGVSQTRALAPDTNKAKDSTASIFEILDSKPTIDSSSNEGATLETVKGDFELQKVSFRYPTRPNIQIFKDLCLSIPAGKIKGQVMKLI
ncbi:ABC transporter B family protein [Medicago truncatula]|uniref:ABC transporter B family protein n=1 Tax=Medicago truncatula TaxID=3880 RepID=A0A072V4T5_MEDTR|nr:ABC transporter B family protein [Medicago truncatula]